MADLITLVAQLALLNDECVFALNFIVSGMSDHAKNKEYVDALAVIVHAMVADESNHRRAEQIIHLIEQPKRRAED